MYNSRLENDFIWDVLSAIKRVKSVLWEIGVCHLTCLILKIIIYLPAHLEPLGMGGKLFIFSEYT